MFQSIVYWVIGALADDSAILSRYVGFYKGIQSAGGAVAWQVDVHNVPCMTQLVVNWGLTTISYPLLALLVLKAVKDEDKVSESEEVLSMDVSAPKSISASAEETNGGLPSKF